MKHGTLVAALIFVSTRVSRALSGEPFQPVPAATLKKEAMAELCNKLCFGLLLSQSSFNNVKFAAPTMLVPVLGTNNGTRHARGDRIKSFCF